MKANNRSGWEKPKWADIRSTLHPRDILIGYLSTSFDWRLYGDECAIYAAEIILAIEPFGRLNWDELLIELGGYSSDRIKLEVALHELIAEGLVERLNSGHYRLTGRGL